MGLTKPDILERSLWLLIFALAISLIFSSSSSPSFPLCLSASPSSPLYLSLSHFRFGVIFFLPDALSHIPNPPPNPPLKTMIINKGYYFIFCSITFSLH